MVAKITEETSRAKLAYTAYELMGPGRSLAKLARQGQIEGKPWARLATLETWSSQFNWQSRVRAYDTEQAEELRKSHEESLRKMNEEHMLIGRTQALRAIRHFEKLMQDGEFSDRAAVQLFKAATDLQRLAMGVSTEQIALTGKDGGPVAMHGAVAVYLPQKGPEI